LEGTNEDHLVQQPGQFRADQKLKHVVKGIVQMPLKRWQAWGIDHLSSKPVPSLDHPLSKEMLPTLQAEPPWCSFEPFPMSCHWIPGWITEGLKGWGWNRTLSPADFQLLFLSKCLGV